MAGRTPSSMRVSLDRAAMLAQFLRARREAQGWSRDRLGRETGLSVNTIRAIESGGLKVRGTTEPGFFTIVAIAGALRIDVAELLIAIGKPDR
ncbi:helix-turn-helix transcriptional regulator [Mycolicibacterium farcinogenes]|nr:DNA-binding protein [Mycobacterium sp. E802]QZH59228.1 helix-turn-helix transcriptional regulator [Mycolicibacterium farcinogenes]